MRIRYYFSEAQARAIYAALVTVRGSEASLENGFTVQDLDLALTKVGIGLRRLDEKKKTQ